MERLHPRDISSPAARAAMASLATTTTTNTSPPDSLLRRGARIARSMLLSPRCVDTAQINTCEKPAQSTNENLGVMVAGGVIAFIVVIIILVLLHMRRNRREVVEFADDRHELADYGLDDGPIKRQGGGRQMHAPAPNIPPNQLSAKQLADMQNPFGAGAEMSDADRAISRGSPPPRYPDAVKM